MNPIKKIVVVDDHPLVREWLTNLIRHQADMTVCGETGSGPEALSLVRLHQPDVAIVDISLASGSGLDLIKDIKAGCAGVAVLVLSMHDEMLYAERALRAGASGYVMKSEATQKMVEGIRVVLSGEWFVSPRVAAFMARKLIGGQSTRSMEQLSDRELEVFQLLGQGKSTRQIAEHLNIGFKTVQGYTARIKEKLNLSNINELMREAIQWHEKSQNAPPSI